MLPITYEVGTRLDRTLLAHHPHLGLRGARRMIQDGLVLVNNVPARPGYRLKPNDSLIELAPVRDCSTPQAKWLGCRNGFHFFYKPADLHTMSLAGRPTPSLEAQLPRLVPEGFAAPILLQRLDYGTCGIVAGGAGTEAVREYREMEKGGRCRKYYLAILAGNLPRAITAKAALDTNGGPKVRVLPFDAPVERWTYFEPLAWHTNATLAKCILTSGRRHQIRAHAASLGFPLLGDALYGQPDQFPFALEHYRLSTPAFDFFHREADSPIFRNWGEIPPLAGESQCM